MAEVPAALTMLGLAVSDELKSIYEEKAAAARKEPGKVRGSLRMEEWQVVVEKQVTLHKQIMTEEFNKNVAAISQRKMEILIFRCLGSRAGVILFEQIRHGFFELELGGA